MSQLSQYSKARVAITVAFIANGSIAGSFYSRIADIKKNLDISNSALGIALLIVALGVLMGLAFSGKQSAKYGSAPITHYATYALGTSLLGLGLANNYATLCLSFLIAMFAFFKRPQQRLQPAQDYLPSIHIQSYDVQSNNIIANMTTLSKEIR